MDLHDQSHAFSLGSEGDRGYDFDHQGSDDEANMIAMIRPFVQSLELQPDWRRREEIVLSRSGSV
jgi:hypothetical protein